MYLTNKIYLILLVGLAGCFEKDIPVEPKPRLSKTRFLDAGETKQLVNYYSFKEDTILAQIDPMTWDIGYRNGILFFNGFRSMQAAPFKSEWKDVKDTSGLNFDYLTVGYPDNMWQLNANQNYVLEFGYDQEYKSLGLYKFFFSETDIDIIFRISKIDGKDEREIALSKGDFHYSFLAENYTEVPFEEEYDMALGKYTDFVIFPDEQSNYLVYGALLGNTMARELRVPYEDVGSSSLDTLDFDHRLRTTIGWDWKYYSLSDGAYSLREDMTFVLKTDEEFYYKLRFVDFYNQDGISGHPTLEYTLL